MPYIENVKMGHTLIRSIPQRNATQPIKRQLHASFQAQFSHSTLLPTLFHCHLNTSITDRKGINSSHDSTKLHIPCPLFPISNYVKSNSKSTRRWRESKIESVPRTTFSPHGLESEWYRFKKLRRKPVRFQRKLCKDHTVWVVGAAKALTQCRSLLQTPEMKPVLSPPHLRWVETNDRIKQSYLGAAVLLFPVILWFGRNFNFSLHWSSN